MIVRSKSEEEHTKADMSYLAISWYDSQKRWLSPYVLMLEMIPEESKIDLKATFDSRVIDEWTT